MDWIGLHLGLSFRGPAKLDHYCQGGSEISEVPRCFTNFEKGPLFIIITSEMGVACLHQKFETELPGPRLMPTSMMKDPNG